MAVRPSGQTWGCGARRRPLGVSLALVALAAPRSQGRLSSANRLRRENHVLNPSPDPVTLVTPIKLQKATKQRNKDEIKVHNSKARERSAQSRFLPLSGSFIIFFPPGATL